MERKGAARMEVLDKARVKREAREQGQLKQTIDIGAIWQQIQQNNEMNQKLLDELNHAGNQKKIEAENAQMRNVLLNVEQNFQNYGKLLMDGMTNLEQRQAAFEIEFIEKIQALKDSNAIVKEVVRQEAQELAEHSQKVVEEMTVNMSEGIEKTLANAGENLDSVWQKHQEVIGTLKRVYAFRGVWTIGGLLFRYMIIMGLWHLGKILYGDQTLISFLKFFLVP
ncbi:MAG: hypothetical protein H6Q73_1079 [Firmicutes bacterium]|nr:hypothetical protein [Bacillota bacterium]